MVVLGPTASGKTRIACALASRLNGEIISVDSRQVYKRLDIGTGKDLQEYQVNGQQIPVHLLDVNDVQDQFYLHDFIRETEKTFSDIISRHRLPVFCGGTGLYLDTLRKDFSLTKVPEQPDLRAKLTDLDKPVLLEKLASYPSHLTATVDLSSKKRIIRGIEIADYLQHQAAVEIRKDSIYKPVYIGLNPDRETLKTLIAARLEQRLKAGLIEEVSKLLEEGIRYERLEQLGLEYKFVSKYLSGEISMPEMHQRLLTAIYQFSKRQMTWFRKMEKEGVEIIWIKPDADPETVILRLKELVSE